MIEMHHSDVGRMPNIRIRTTDEPNTKYSTSRIVTVKKNTEYSVDQMLFIFQSLLNANSRGSVIIFAIYLKRVH